MCNRKLQSFSSRCVSPVTRQKRAWAVQCRASLSGACWANHKHTAFPADPPDACHWHGLGVWATWYTGLRQDSPSMQWDAYNKLNQAILMKVDKQPSSYHWWQTAHGLGLGHSPEGCEWHWGADNREPWSTTGDRSVRADTNSRLVSKCVRADVAQTGWSHTPGWMQAAHLTLELNQWDIGSPMLGHLS